MLLTVEGLDVGRGPRRALGGVFLDVPEGAVVCLLGSDGTGRSALLKALIGIEPVRAGRILFRGRDVTRLKVHERERLGLRYAPPRPMFPHLTVEENLQVAGGHAAAGTTHALELFPGLGPLLQRRAGTLPVGRQQQLAIARAAATGPAMLLLDPCAGVPPAVVAETEAALHRLRAAGVAILLAEDHVDVVLRLADAFVVLDGGGVVGTGTRAELDDETVRALVAA
jgi:urea transport system ATP-binding protein